MRVLWKKKNIIVLMFLLCVLLLYMLLRSPGLEIESLDKTWDNSDYIRNDGEPVDEVAMSDPFRSYLINGSNVYNKIRGSVCLERRNYVFIKTMKCATQTLVQVFRRFGYKRRLNFVLPRKDNIYLGWPFILERQDYRSSSKPYNALVEHSVYNETVFTKLMPKDTMYFSIIREPWSHFKSAFSYFNVANISRVKESRDPMLEYLHNLEKYETFYKTPEASPTRYCIPNGFSVTKNLLSHCLGMPLGFPAGRENITSDLAKVQAYIETLDKNFALIMIMEYFHESLVLLKRLMCWSMEDILYHMINVGTYANKFHKPEPEDLAILQKWSHVDFLLYDHFNKTFWTKVKEQGDDFFPELAVYNSLQSRVTDYCSNPEANKDPVTFKANEFHGEIVLDRDYCILIGIDLLKMLKTRHEIEELKLDSSSEVPAVGRGC